MKPFNENWFIEVLVIYLTSYSGMRNQWWCLGPMHRFYWDGNSASWVHWGRITKIMCFGNWTFSESHITLPWFWTRQNVGKISNVPHLSLKDNISLIPLCTELLLCTCKACRGHTVLVIPPLPAITFFSQGSSHYHSAVVQLFFPSIPKLLLFPSYLLPLLNHNGVLSCKFANYKDFCLKCFENAVRKKKEKEKKAHEQHAVPCSSIALLWER